MTTLVQVIAMLTVALLGTMVVITKKPLDAVLALAFFGLTVVNLCLVLQAPDVALSALVAWAVANPLMILLAMAKARRREE
jgi:energy-converting hydrogenase B subunit D